MLTKNETKYITDQLDELLNSLRSDKPQVLIPFVTLYENNTTEMGVAIQFEDKTKVLHYIKPPLGMAAAELSEMKVIINAFVAGWVARNLME